MPHLDTEISVKSTHKSSGKRQAANCSGMEFGLECGGGSEDHQRQEAGGVAIKMEQARARLLRGSTSAGTATRSPESRRRSSGTERRKTEDEERAAIQIRPSRALNYCHFFFF